MVLHTCRQYMCVLGGQTYTSEDAKVMEEAFSGSQVYLGGFYPPNRIARQPVTLLHGQGHLQGAREVSPGVYIGGTAPNYYSTCISIRLNESCFSIIYGSLLIRFGTITMMFLDALMAAP